MYLKGLAELNLMVVAATMMQSMTKFRLTIEVVPNTIFCEFGSNLSFFNAKVRQ